jgi:hypothetical protein
MKPKTSTSHDEAMIRRIRRDPEFAAEYLKAALEDGDEPRVLLIALRHIAQARGKRGSRRLLASREKASIEPCRLAATHAYRRFTPLPKRWA